MHTVAYEMLLLGYHPTKTNRRRTLTNNDEDVVIAIRPDLIRLLGLYSYLPLFYLENRSVQIN